MALHRFSGVVSRHDSYPDSNLFLTLYSQYRVQSKVPATVRSVAVFPIAHIRYRLRYHLWERPLWSLFRSSPAARRRIGTGPFVLKNAP